MSDNAQLTEDDSQRLIVAITDFLRDQLSSREDLLPEDRDCLEIAIQCLEMAYGLDPNGCIQLRYSRPLLDIFTQVTNPVSVRDRIRAESHKDDGNEYMKRNMYQNAEDEYTSAIQLDRWNSIYYCNRAGARIEQQNFFDAITDCREALMLNPDYAKAYGRMGQAYALLNRPREAARCFRRAMQLDPRNERYRNNLSVAERQLHRPDVLGLVSGVLSSVFGSESQTDASVSQGTHVPPSIMIFTDSSLPERVTPRRRTLPDQNDSRAIRPGGVGTGCSYHRSAFRRSIGPIISKSTRSPAAREDHTSDDEDRKGVDGEISIGIPGYPYPPEVVPVCCPREDGYKFPKNNEPESINIPTMYKEKDESTHPDTHDVEAGRYLGINQSKSKDEENSKHFSPKTSQNNAIDTPMAQNGVFDNISSQTSDYSSRSKSSQTNIEKELENSKLSALESDKNSTTDKSKAEDTDSKQVKDELPFGVSRPQIDEGNKINEDDKKNIVPSSQDTESAIAENNADHNSSTFKADERKENKTAERSQSEESAMISRKTIASESELFDTIQSYEASDEGKSKENLDVKSNVTDENESRDKSTGAN